MKWLFQSTAIILTGILNNSQDLTVYIPLSRQPKLVNTVGSRFLWLTVPEKTRNTVPTPFFLFDWGFFPLPFLFLAWFKRSSSTLTSTAHAGMNPAETSEHGC